MSRPSKRTRPWLGRSSPLTVLSTVDFPAPLGPIRQVTVPALTMRSTPLRMSPAPYPATTPSSSSMAATSGSQVRVEDRGGVLYLARWPAEDGPPGVEHDDRVAQPHHEPEVVL